MQRILVLLLLGCGLLLAAAVLVMSQTADEAIDAYVTIQGQPSSAAELALQSRQTPPVAVERTRSWAGAGLLALALVVVAAFLLAMRGGTDLLRQWRLVRKPPLSPPTAQFPMPQIPTGAPGYYAPPVDRLPRVQRTQELPQWTESD